MSKTNRVYSVLAAFEHATTRSDYSRAKRLAAGLDTIGQLAIGDSLIAACRRLRAQGVL
jgi:hypothetical protein